MSAQTQTSFASFAGDNLRIIPIGASLTSVTVNGGAATAALTVGSGAVTISAPAIVKGDVLVVNYNTASLRGALDIESGTFATAFTATTGTVTADPALNTLSFHRTGRLVTIFGMARVSAIAAPTGELSLTGLPYANQAGTQQSARTALAVRATGLAAGATTSIVAAVLAGAQVINLDRYAAGATAGDLASLVAVGSQFWLGGSYLID